MTTVKKNRVKSALAFAAVLALACWLGYAIRGSSSRVSVEGGVEAKAARPENGPSGGSTTAHREPSALAPEQIAAINARPRIEEERRQKQQARERLAERRTEDKYGELWPRLAAVSVDPAGVRRKLIEIDLVYPDFFQALAAANLDPKELRSEAVGAQLKALNDKAQKELRDALGPNGGPVYELYESQKPERALADELNARLDASDKLSQPQRDALVSALYDQKNDSGARDTVRVDQRSIRTVPAQVVSQLNASLAPAQISALRNLAAEQSALQPPKKPGS